MKLTSHAGKRRWDGPEERRLSQPEPKRGSKLFLPAAMLVGLVGLLWLLQGPSAQKQLPAQGEARSGSQVRAGPADMGPRSDAEPTPAGPKPTPSALNEEPARDLSNLSASGATDPQGTDKTSSEQSEGWDGDWLTQSAMSEPEMSGLSPDDPDYDASTEARQLFHPFEMDLRAVQPLEPLHYRELLGRHKKTNARALRRVNELRRAGHPAAASRLYAEWSRLFELYRRQAYADRGSQSPPGLEAPP